MGLFPALVFANPDADLLKAETPAQLRAALRAGANVNARDTSGGTALTSKVLLHTYLPDKKYIEMLKILLAAKADVNIQDNNGWTPLMFAAGSDTDSTIGLVKMILAAKPNVHLKNKKGENATYLAGNSEVRALLEKAGGSYVEPSAEEKEAGEHAAGKESLRSCRESYEKGSSIYYTEKVNLSKLPDMRATCKTGSISVCSSHKTSVKCPYGTGKDGRILKGTIDAYSVTFFCTLSNGESFYGSTGYFQNARGDVSKQSVPCAP
jgi:uncharacterized protein